MRCLLLDDNSDFCRQFKFSCEKNFAQSVVFSHSVDEAKAQFENETGSGNFIDIIFVDYFLDPGETGLDFLLYLRDEGVSSPIVFLTDYDDEAVINRAAELGAAHINKSNAFDPSILSDVVNSAYRSLREFNKYRISALAQSPKVLNVGGEIAHEMASTVLAVDGQIDFISEMISDGSIDVEEFQRSRDLIRGKLQEATELIDILLDYRTYQKVELKPKAISLKDFLDQIIGDNNEFSSLSIENKVDDRFCFTTDDRLLKRILLVLLSNVISHVGADAQVVFSASDRTVGTVNHVELKVADNGDGVPKGFEDSIFEAGDRAGKEVKYEEGSGLGLGLPFARTLASQMECCGSCGSVYYEDVDSCGARFVVSLPDLAE